MATRAGVWRWRWTEPGCPTAGRMRRVPLPEAHPKVVLLLTNMSPIGSAAMPAQMERFDLVLMIVVLIVVGLLLVQAFRLLAM